MEKKKKYKATDFYGSVFQQRKYGKKDLIEGILNISVNALSCLNFYKDVLKVKSIVHKINKKLSEKEMLRDKANLH